MGSALPVPENEPPPPPKPVAKMQPAKKEPSSPTDISDSVLTPLTEYIGNCTPNGVEDQLRLKMDAVSPVQAQKLWLIYRDWEAPKYAILTFYMKTGDYFCHVPIKTTTDDSGIKYFVDSLPKECFTSIRSLAERQVAVGDPDGLPCAFR